MEIVHLAKIKNFKHFVYKTFDQMLNAFAILLIVVGILTKTAMAAGGNEVEQVFKQHKVVPDVLAKAPAQFLTVNYGGDLKADKGVELTPTQVKAAPMVDWNAEPDAFYTLIMTDPDAPSRQDPKFREYHHWLVTNIPGNSIDKGDIITAYVGSGPPKGTGLHRYIFLVYKQPGKLSFDEPRIPKNSGSNRGKFSAKKFANKHKLGDPIAANFYQAQWDDYVPTVHKQLAGK